MFAQKISTIESQIQELTRKADQYRALDSEMIAAVEALARIQKSAAELDPEIAGEVTGELAKSLGISASVPNQESEILRQQLESDNQALRDKLETETNYFEDQKISYSQMLSELRERIVGFEFSYEGEFMLTSGKSAFPDGEEQELIEIAQSLYKTPLWCLEARMRYTWERACNVVRERLAAFLPNELASMWRQFAESEQDTPKTIDVLAVSQDDLANATLQYETPEQIKEALADEEEVDRHLIAIASILDSCPEIEIPGRIWFFVQNIPVEFDDRILGYLPKSIRPEWHKQRTAWEEEARASIFPPETTVKVEDKPEIKIEIKPGDRVQIHTGEICTVLQAKDIGGRIYVEVTNSEGRKEAYRDTDLKLIDKVEPDQWVSLVDSDEDDEEDYELGMGDDWEESISDAASVLDPAPEQQEELFELDDIVQVASGALSEALPKAIATIQSIDFIGVSASYTLRMPNGKNQSGFKAFDLKKMGKLEPPTAQQSAQQSQRAAEVQKLAQTCLTKRSWSQIRTLCDRAILEEMKAIAESSAEKRLINNLPSLISGYIRKSGDKSDLKWLPEDLLDEVEQLITGNDGLDQTASTTLNSRGVA